MISKHVEQGSLSISDSAGKDYAKQFLGHLKSPYWTRKEQEKREIYATKCMKYLTFLDRSKR